MPEKDPNNWATIFALWDAVPPSIKGAIMAFIIAILRVVYDRQETSNMRIMLEGLICGCLTYSMSEAILFVGAPESLAIPVGGTIGFIGVMKLRQLALGWLVKKTGGNDAN